MPDPFSRPAGLPSALRPSATDAATPEPAVDVRGSADAAAPAEPDVGAEPTPPLASAATAEPAEPAAASAPARLPGGTSSAPLDSVDVVGGAGAREHLPTFTRPTDTVTAPVDRGRDVRPRSTNPSLSTHLTPGSAAVDLRVDANRARAGVDAGTGALHGTGSADLDRLGVRTTGRVDLDHGDGGRSSVDARLGVDTNRDTTWGVAGNTRRRTRSRAAEVAAEIERRRSGDYRGSVDSSVHTRDASGDVRHTTTADVTHSDAATRAHANHRVNIGRDGDSLSATADATVTRGRDGYAADVSLDGSRALADGVTRDEGRLRAHLDSGGGYSANGTGTSTRDVGGVTATGTARFDVDATNVDLGADARARTTRAGATTDATATLDVTLGAAPSARGNASVSDVRTHGDSRTTRTLNATGSGSRDRAAGTVTASYGTRGPDGTRDARTSANVNWSGNGGTTGGVDARYTDTTGSGASHRAHEVNVDIDVDATGFNATGAGRRTVGTTADGHSVGASGRLRVDERNTTGTVSLTGRGASGTGDDRTAWDVGTDVSAAGDRGSGTVRGTVEVGPSGALRVDANGRVDIDGTGPRGNADVRARFDVGDREHGGAAVDARARGAVDANGALAGNASVSAAGAAGAGDGRVTWSADATIDGTADGVRARANAAGHYGTPTSPLEVDGTARGEVGVTGAGVTGSGAAAGTVTNRDTPGLVTETHVEVATTGGPPSVAVYHERRHDSGPATRVTANAEFSDRAATLEYERTNNNATDGHFRRLNARLGVRPESVDVSTNIEGPVAGLERITGRATVDRTGVSVNADGRLDRSRSVNATVGHDRDRLAVSIGGSGYDVSGVDGNFDTRISLGEHAVDGLFTSTASFDSKLGRAAISLAGHVGKVEKITAGAEVTDVPGLQGQRRVVMENSNHFEFAVGGGLSVGAIGGGATVRGGKLHSFAYVTHRPAAEAAALERDASASHVIPDPAKPEQLREHDVLRAVMSGDLGLSADLSLFGVGFSGRARLRADFSFTVEKAADEHVRVTVEPQKIYGVGVEGNALVTSAGVNWERSRMLSQTFELDLKTDAGRDAYRRALAGELPQATITAALDDPDDAVALVDRVNAELPAGVRALAFAQASSDRFSRTAAVRWTLLGRSREVSSTTTGRDTAVAGRVVSERGREHEVVNRTFFSGTEKAGVFSVLEDESAVGADGEVETTFERARFGARFSDDWVGGFEFNDVTNALADVLGKPLDGMGAEGDGEKRSVELMVTVPVSFFASAFDGSTEARVRAAGVGRGGTSPVTEDFLKALTKAHSPASRAEALHEFVAAGGMPAIGTLLRAFPGLKPNVIGKTDRYDNAVRGAEDYLEAYPGKADASQATAFGARFAAATKALRPLSTALEALAAEPFMDDDARAKEEKRLTGLRRRIDKSISLQEADLYQLTTLYNDVGSGIGGWFSSDDLFDFINHFRRARGWQG